MYFHIAHKNVNALFSSISHNKPIEQVYECHGAQEAGEDAPPRVPVHGVEEPVHVPAVGSLWRQCSSNGQYKPPGLRLPVQQRPARALAPWDGEVNDSLFQSGHLVYNRGIGTVLSTLYSSIL